MTHQATATPTRRGPAARGPVAFVTGMLALAAAGCAGTPQASDIRGAWRIEQAQRELILDRREARIVFGTDGRISGNTSCNLMGADYTLEGSRLQIGPVVTTRRACARPLMEQEDRILTALELARDARVRPDGLLELRGADGRGVLRGTRLVAVPPEADAGAGGTEAPDAPVQR